ncbi:MAG: DinB family protein [Acidimicrobiales bacterium]
MERIHPDFTGDERTLLTQFLDYHRATLLMKTDGLDESQVRRTVAGSDMSLLGLVRHMAEVERFWFRICFVGEDIGARWVNDAGRDAAFHPSGTDTLSEATAAYLEEIERADEIVATASLDGRVVHHPRGHQIDMRWILIHMVTETARHNGHADLIRQSVDGVTGR